MIKAIETSYNGYRFRSRLEARWAVFFDALDIPFQYEREGFDLGDGFYYLPDFWLPEQELWIEIKGQLMTSVEAEKVSRLRAEHQPIAVFVGEVRYPLGGILYSQESGDSGGGFAENLATWAWCTKHRRFELTSGDEYHCLLNGNWESVKICMDFPGTWYEHPRIHQAIAAARSARFERI